MKNIKKISNRFEKQLLLIKKTAINPLPMGSEKAPIINNIIKNVEELYNYITELLKK